MVAVSKSFPREAVHRHALPAMSNRGLVGGQPGGGCRERREQCRSPDVDPPERWVDVGPHRQRRSDGEPAISSPDGRLLAFRRGVSGGDAIMVAPLGAEQPVPPRAWIELVAPEADARPCGWSPDGTLVYCVSGRDGTRCLYAQRVDRTSGTPIGEPFVVRHFHGVRTSFIADSMFCPQVPPTPSPAASSFTI